MNKSVYALVMVMLAVATCRWHSALGQPIAGKWVGVQGTTTVTFTVNTSRTAVDSLAIKFGSPVCGTIRELSLYFPLPISGGKFSFGTFASGTFVTSNSCVGTSTYVCSADNTAIVPWIAAPQSATYSHDSESPPASFALYQNYPNPFNPTTLIQFDLPREELAVLRVYNMLGREIAELVNERKWAGRHTVIFDAREMANGLYFYRLQAGSFMETKKLLLLR